MATKKVLVVPDVHGRMFWKDIKQLSNDADYVVFLGDYVDPYAYEPDIVSEPHELVDNLNEIVQFARNNESKVKLIIGNHDAHYLSDNDNIRSTRYDSRVKSEMQQIIKCNPDLFVKSYVIGNTLFTHAGVVEGWLDYNGYTGDKSNINEVSDFINAMSIEVTAQVGYSRGGSFANGGPMWADLEEHQNNKLPFEQIIGHTQLKNKGQYIIIPETKICCCDSRFIHTFEIEC